ncbi:homocysteine S-methyltransferase family protein [bacterium]|nr:homocysteine S-methyltransferase family protein [bacterium]
MISLKEFFDIKKTILFDGAAGTNLLEKSGSLPCPDLLNFYATNLVESLHEAYLEAGCDVIETNSFNSNPISFENFGITENAYDCAKTAAMLAKKAAEKFSTAEKPRFVAGSVGPIFNKNGIEQDETLLFEAFSIQISALSEGGADLLIFETWQDIIQLNSALDAAKQIAKDIPLIVSLSGKNGRTFCGTPFERFAETLSKYDISAFGINCEDMESITEDIEIIKKTSDLPLILMPNLGLPEKTGVKLVYKTNPAEFAEKMSEIIKKFNPKIIGGCCGTTPEHIAALWQRTSVS